MIFAGVGPHSLKKILFDNPALEALLGYKEGDITIDMASGMWYFALILGVMYVFIVFTDMPFIP